MIKRLLETSRPVTGLFAGLLTVAGFRYFSPTSWALVILTAVGFTGITWSVMTFNDLVDKEHDRKKNKNFVSEHFQEVHTYWKRINAITAVILLYASSIDFNVAWFCAVVWVMGLLYSYVPHWYIVQNLIVALCSASPVLLGPIHHRDLPFKPLLVFVAFVFIIFIREVYKDMEDSNIDAGYKVTMPVVVGHKRATLRVIVLTHGWVACLAVYPNYWFPAIATLATASQFIHIQMFNRPHRVLGAKQVLDWVIRLLMFAVLLTQ